MLNQELRFPVLTHLTLGTPFGDLDFPEIQGGLFVDVGKATFPTEASTGRCSAATGVSFRLALAPTGRAAARRRAAGSPTTTTGATA